MPAVSMSTLVASMTPPSVAIIAWPPPAVALIVASRIEIRASFPTAKMPLAPSPVVLTEPPVMVTVPSDARIPALRP